MEFVLVVAVAAALAGWRWWRQGRRLKEVIFFGTIRTYTQLWHRWWMQGGDPLPATGPVLVVSNHTCSADPTLLQIRSRRVFCWLTSREQYDQHWLVRKLFDRLHCVPINRDGKDAAAAPCGLERLREGRVICIFPEGNLSGVALGRLRAPKAGAAWLALAQRRGGDPGVHLSVVRRRTTCCRLGTAVAAKRAGDVWSAD